VFDQVGRQQKIQMEIMFILSHPVPIQVPTINTQLVMILIGIFPNYRLDYGVMEANFK
jgi:hypothetical protein